MDNTQPSGTTDQPLTPVDPNQTYEGTAQQPAQEPPEVASIPDEMPIRTPKEPPAPTAPATPVAAPTQQVAPISVPPATAQVQAGMPVASAQAQPQPITQTAPIASTTVTPAATPAPQPVPPPAPAQTPSPTPAQTPPSVPVKPKPKETDEDSDPEKKSGGLISFIVTIVIALLLTQVINVFFFQSYRVFGSSMFSTLHDGDRLIVNKIPKTATKITHKTFQPQRGQIIVFTSPKDPSLQLVKRVIGLPGERVVVKNGKITVYNSEHPKGFNPDKADYGKNIPPSSGEADVTVPKGELFVSGDNRTGSNSLDSRNELGTVPEGLVIGTVAVRLWPIDSARFF